LTIVFSLCRFLIISKRISERAGISILTQDLKAFVGLPGFHARFGGESEATNQQDPINRPNQQDLQAHHQTWHGILEDQQML
jgi:hypothetical protein